MSLDSLRAAVSTVARETTEAAPVVISDSLRNALRARPDDTTTLEERIEQGLSFADRLREREEAARGEREQHAETERAARRAREALAAAERERRETAEREERQRVDAESEEVEDRERPEQDDGHRDRGDQHRAPALQEDEHHKDDQQNGLEQ